MRLRSITVGHRQGIPLRRDAIKRAGEFARRAKAAFEGSGYQVETVRLATQPISSLLGSRPPSDAIVLAREIEAEVASAGIDYCSLGPVMAVGPGDAGPLIRQVPLILGATKQVFLSVMAATSRHGINLKAVHQTAQALVAAGQGDAEGARSRRLTLSANVPPNGPFFPSAYHAGRGASFALAIAAADLAVEAFSEATSLAAAAKGLTHRLLEHGGALQRIAQRLERESSMSFHGMDISLAPFPEEAHSIGYALERLGVGRFGTHGTLFAAAFVTSILKEMPLPKCGFSGLMIPLLEDSVMASRHAEGAYSLDSLLLYSSVCGAGLDTIPIPGDATADQIASVYLDVCTLSVALRKPLTARLMPLAGRKAGDPVRFAFPYFAPTRVVELGPGSGALFTKGEWTGRLGG